MELTRTDAVFSTIAMVLFCAEIKVLGDLNGTNLDGRRFQQNCHGVIFV